MALFSPEHVAAIAATALVALLLVVAARRADDRAATRLARGLAILVLAGFVVEHAAYLGSRQRGRRASTCRCSSPTPSRSWRSRRCGRRARAC